MRKIAFFHLVLWLALSCENPAEPVYLGQGILAGEVSTHSVILQSRLTQSDTLIQGDLPGQEGTGYFEWARDSTFNDPQRTPLLRARAQDDYILKVEVDGLQPGMRYYYRLHYGTTDAPDRLSPVGTFRTLPGATSNEKVSLIVVTGMNYYRFHYGNYDRDEAYAGPDKSLGYPALEAIRKREPDYFIGTGDNVYFDHPDERSMQRAREEGKNPHPGGYEGKAVSDEAGICRKYHEQFRQPRFVQLFREVATYWEKDDHEYRFNDADPHRDFPISHELGIRSFREQLPVVPPGDSLSPTYRTHRMNADLQIWLLEGRDYRSDNTMPDGPDKTIWGAAQLDWLKSTLQESDATFKIIISPTPLVGPDDGYKSDNHTNPKGFRHEGDAFHRWLAQHDFPGRNLYIVCGDRHWQYHAQHPDSGIEEFSTGALVDNNSRPGRKAGDPESTDPEGRIRQFYIQDSPETASGGFLEITVERVGESPLARFRFFDEKGKLQYELEKLPKD